jgi:hypothetical protein
MPHKAALPGRYVETEARHIRVGIIDQCLLQERSNFSIVRAAFAEKCQKQQGLAAPAVQF